MFLYGFSSQNETLSQDMANAIRDDVFENKDETFLEYLVEEGLFSYE